MLAYFEMLPPNLSSIHMCPQRASDSGQDHDLPAKFSSLQCRTVDPSRCGRSSISVQLPLHQLASFQADSLTSAIGDVQPAGVAPPGKPDVGQAYVYSVLMFVFPMIGAVALVHSNRLAIQIQIKLRAELNSAVYRKALRLSGRCISAGPNCEPREGHRQMSGKLLNQAVACLLCRAKQMTETGRIVNLMSADVNNVMVKSFNVHCACCGGFVVIRAQNSTDAARACPHRTSSTP